tara:strand:+ start:3196 stop:3669 length:474 start_codon:yes stop_codon:yes gene_type:complete
MQELEDKAKRDQLMKLISMLDGKLEEPVDDMARDDLREGGKEDVADIRDVAEHVEAPLDDKHPLEDEHEETESMMHRDEESSEDLMEDARDDAGHEARDEDEMLKEMVLGFMNPKQQEQPQRSRMMSMDPSATVSKTSVSVGEAKPMKKKSKKKSRK